VLAVASVALAAAPPSPPKTRPGQFLPAGSARRVDGELVAADFIHRTGQFRAATGELHDFMLPPQGVLRQRNADADLRDVPLGASCRFFLHPDVQGQFTRLALLLDQFSADAADGITYRLDEARPGRLLTTRHGTDLGRKTEVPVTERTRYWKGGKQAKFTDLAVGDELLINLSDGSATDVWAGGDSHRTATEAQRQKHAAFLRDRGLAGYVNRTEGKTLTVTLFGGDRAEFAKAWAKDFAAGRDVHVVVANEELRTWNPPVDHERGKGIELQHDPVEGYGNSGMRLRVTVNFMLEGFRRGRVVRVFAGGWRLKDQPFGEQLFHYGARSFPPELMELPPKEYPEQFPFRTDWGNEHLPWYRLRAGVAPPEYAGHLVFGELASVGSTGRTGRFLTDRTGTPIDFALTPEGKVRYLNVVHPSAPGRAEGDLSAIPLGTRCRFSLFQDAAGAFTKAGLVTDEASDLLANGALWRVTALNLTAGTLDAARQPPGVKNDQGDSEQPPDIGRARLRVGPETVIWKGDRKVTLGDLAVGDLLLVNFTGERPGRPSRLTDVWVGIDTHKLVAERQAKKAPAPKR
jgi:hypothetical protein